MRGWMDSRGGVIVFYALFLCKMVFIVRRFLFLRGGF